MEELNQTTPNRRTVLVTGGCGFIGGALLRRMVPRHPDVNFINIDDLRAGSNEEALHELEGFSNYRFVKAAIEFPEQIDMATKGQTITDIIHLAAESDVDRSINSVQQTHETNVIGTINLLEKAREWLGSTRFVYVSTDEVYGPLSDKDAPKKEIAPVRPSSPYSASKSAAESYVMAYKKTYGLDVSITRGANTFGPYQDYTKLIPVAVKALREGRKIPIYGDGLQMREWLPVELHAEAIEKVWFDGLGGHIYNIGTGFTCTNLELAQLLIDVCGSPEESLHFVTDRPGHDYRYAINNQKMRALGWPVDPEALEPIEIVRGIKDTAEWYYAQNVA